MSWSKHETDIYPEIVLGDQGSLALIATVQFKYHPGSPATWDDPADGYEVDDVRVISLAADHGGGKITPLPLIPEICEWITETADRAVLAEAANDDVDDGVEADSYADMEA